MTKPPISLQDLRRRIYRKAKSDKSHRLWGLFVHVAKMETLEEAYRAAKRNGGAPGVDGQTFADIERAGCIAFLEAIREALITDRYKPMANRRVDIPKSNGKVRTLQIPCIRDRVLGGAPYGYRYIRKTDEALAAYIVEESEARVVQRIYEMYTVDGLSIGEITRRLNAEGIPTRNRSTRWERSFVWAVLRNPAYRGAACFGKTRASSRTRVMRSQRRRGAITPSMTAGHERPCDEWIEIPVPALVSEETSARAQGLLQENRIRSRRRTIEPSVVQGLVSCAKCGYAFARTSTQTSARKIHYYKCIGSDSWRKPGGPVCDNRQFVRQELLDRIVWDEVIRLLEDPTLIRQELDRRLEAARSSDPAKKREQSLQRELTQVGKGIERLLNAYQEGLLSIEQLRDRMPLLRQRERAIRAEIQAIVLEKQLSVDPTAKYPVCTDGRLACPPEDCGGIPGFYDLVAAIADPNHEQHKELKDWLGYDFDPIDFSIDSVNQVLLPARRRGKTAKK